MEHFNAILFHKSEPANKQHTNQSIIYNISRKAIKEEARNQDLLVRAP
jgi:hypothetical protein